MIITTWNCNLKLKSKYEYIESLDSDILIIQECEKLKQDYFPNTQYFWTGRDENKGLGVLVKKDTAKISKLHNQNFIHFLPIEIDGLNVMGVWAFNHRAVKYGEDANGRTLEAINYYNAWLKDSQKSIFAGDFNNSIIWDKTSNPDFHNINNKLNLLGYESSYHKKTQDIFGKEKETTFYHTKKEDKKYHIDYIYTKEMNIKSLDIGLYDNWIKHSDHCPVSIEV